MNRRLFIGTLAAGGVGAAAGCLSSFVDDATTFTAAPARVSEEAVREAGYEYQGTEKRVDEDRMGGEDVEVTSYASLYDRTIDLPAEYSEEPVRAGVFGVATTPQVTVGDESFNPVGDLSDGELAAHVQNRYDGLEIGRSVGGRAVESLGEQFSLTSYEGTATLRDDFELDVLVDVAQPDHDGDHLVIAAVYPADDLVPDESEQERIDALVADLNHYDGLDVEIVERSGDEG
ncbi:DUF6517 family protein [Natrinema salifodinae]|uniref:Uncharacterized protein n=1 Tax=Natrinema salifodinae TaxID=1202768 RepID=A0A1I0QXQ9_9EURY|nr:DUF6517 family protein [Natrinema salifodinae]SEW32371.1 hypothetical protein SAMN05216285_4093 [Natrinema salifodinae]